MELNHYYNLIKNKHIEIHRIAMYLQFKGNLLLIDMKKYQKCKSVIKSCSYFNIDQIPINAQVRVQCILRRGSKIPYVILYSDLFLVVSICSYIPGASVSGL